MEMAPVRGGVEIERFKYYSRVRGGFTLSNYNPREVVAGVDYDAVAAAALMAVSVNGI